MNLDEIREDLEFLKVYEAVIFGSYVTGDFRVGSDIDIAVISRTKDQDKNVDLLKSILGMGGQIYDLRIFELLPLKVKATLMDDYLVLFGDELEISEYFYGFRKEWDDQKHRILDGYFTSYKEKIAAMRAKR